MDTKLKCVFFCVLGLFISINNAHALKLGETDVLPVYIGVDYYALIMDIGQESIGGYYGEKILPKGYAGVSINAGIRPFKYLGFEGTYLQNGHTSSEEIGLGGYSVKATSSAKFNLWILKVLGFVPVPFTNHHLEAFGSVGFGEISYKVDVNVAYHTPEKKSGEVGRIAVEDSSSGMPISAGLEYRPEKSNLSARVEYTRFTLNKPEGREPSDMLTVGIKWHF